jgi:hypothetical protein
MLIAAASQDKTFSLTKEQHAPVWSREAIARRCNGRAEGLEELPGERKLKERNR